ncbi:MAG: hypothetical protein ACXVHB_25600 [Solirubrobacteraceae bacterium]
MPRPKGSATDIGRSTKSSAAETSEMRTRSPANSRNPIIASSAATPPPRMITSAGAEDEAPVGMPGKLGDARRYHIREDYCSPRGDLDQTGLEPATPPYHWQARAPIEGIVESSSEGGEPDLALEGISAGARQLRLVRRGASRAGCGQLHCTYRARRADDIRHVALGRGFSVQGPDR